jgi:hypothetical protein
VTQENFRIEFHLDQDGRDIVSVPITGNRKVVLYEEDFDLLMDLGTPVHWTTHLGSVKARPARGYDLSIARLIVDAGQGCQIKHLNGDKTDLRRKNLILKTGIGKRRTRDQLLEYLNRCETRAGFS